MRFDATLVDLMEEQQRTTRALAFRCIRQLKRRQKQRRRKRIIQRNAMRERRPVLSLRRSIYDQKRVPIDFCGNILRQGPSIWRVMFGKISPTLLKKITESIPFNDQRKHKLTPRNRIALFIYRMHTGHTLEHVAWNFGVSVSLCARTFKDVLFKLNKHLASEIHLPTPEEVRQIDDLMALNQLDFPNARHIIDGTHCRLHFNDGWNQTH